MKKGVFKMKTRNVLSLITLLISVSLVVQSSKALQAQDNECIPAPSGLVAWWKGEGNVDDIVAANNGVGENLNYSSGKVGNAFYFNGSNSYVRVQASASLNVGIGDGLTFETWIKPVNLERQAIAEWNDNTGDIGTHFFITESQFPTLGGGPTGCLYANLVDASGTSHVISTSGGLVDSNIYQHVALTYDKASGTAVLYLNGSAVKTAFLGSFTPQTSYQFYLGTRPSGAFAGAFFNGIIDEPSLYDRALSASEIDAIYSAGSAGKYLPPGPMPAPSGLVAWWPAEDNGNDIAGGHNGSWAGYGSTDVYAPGKVGHAFVFDGIHRDRLDIGNPAALQLQDFTIETWVKRSSTSVASLDENFADGSIAGPGGYIFGYGAGGYGLFLTDAGEVGLTKNSTGDVRTSPIITDTNWHYVAATKSGTNVVFYVDGVKQPSPGPDTHVFQFTTSAAIGSRGDGGGNTFYGLVDELSIYNRPLSSNEISNIYNAGGAGKSLPTMTGVPQIVSVSPTVATNGAIIQISGDNFGASENSNIVYFGAVRATVLSASSTNLTVSVPAGATYGPVTVTTGGLTASSDQLFEPTFAGNDSPINNNSFKSSFTLPTGAGPGSVVIADLDGDGKPDLAEVNGNDHTLSIFHNIGSGGTLDVSSFAPRVNLGFPTNGIGGNPYRLRAVDLDGDGKLDLVACEVYGNRVTIFHNIANPGILDSNSFDAGFCLIAGNDCRSVTTADLDKDGRVDIVALNYGAKTISLFKNIGIAGQLSPASFAPAVSLSAPGGPYEAVATDLNGDGKPDLAVANSDSGTISVYQNISLPNELSTNSFAPPIEMAAGNTSAAIVATDLDGDGKKDLVVGSVQSQMVSIFQNVSNGGILTTNSFAGRLDFSTTDWTHSLAIADFNGDGKPDINVVGELPSLMAIFQNTSEPGPLTTNSLATRVDFGTGWNAWGVAAGDLDGDGRPDVVFANDYDSTIQIYQNQSSFNEVSSLVSGLVGWWKGDGNGIDSVGGNNGTLVNVGFTNGMVGQAFSFDPESYPYGTYTGVQVADKPAYALTNSLTIEGWVRPRGDGYVIFFRGDHRPGMDPYALSMQANDQLDFEITDAAGNYQRLDTAIPYQQWTYVAATLDGNTGLMSIYTNGLLAVQITTSVRPFGALLPDQSPGIGIGNVNDGGNNFPFVGDIDEISLYNRSLSPTEIQAIYNAGSAGKNLPGIPPIITSQPIGQVVTVNESTSLSVEASGTPSPNYQWRFNDADIEGATNSTFVLSNAQLGNAGAYSVVVSNPSGSIISSNAFIKVLLPPISGLVAYYPFSGSAYDASGNGNDGTVIGASQTSDRQDAQNAAYAFTGSTSPQSSIQISTTQFSLNPEFSFSAWVNFDGGTENPRIFSTAGWEVATVGTGSSRIIDFNTLTTANLYDCRSAHYFGAGTWHHVVAVRSTNAMMLYIDGQLEGNIPATGAPDYSRDSVPQIGINSINLHDAFGGKIDEVCIFNRALSAGEVSSLYKAGNAGDFLEKPQIISQPVAQNVIEGDQANFSIDATGLNPLTFQWMFNGNPITDATNKTLVIPDAQLAQAGDYSVMVANTAGTTVSANASLTVTVPDCAPLPSGLVAWWPAQNNAIDIVAGLNGTLMGDATFTTGKVGQAFSFSGNDMSCVQIPYNPALITSNYTVETWIKPTAQVTGGIGQTLIFGQSYGHIQLLARTGATGVRIAVQFGVSHYAFYDAESSIEIPIGQFTHIAGSWDGTNLCLYINGKLDAETTPVTTPVDSGCDFFIGGFNSPETDSCQYVGQFFQGAVDELSYYNCALSPDEIQAIYQAGSAGKGTNTLHANLPPFVSDFSPKLGTNGTVVTLTGTNFSPVITSNIVYFGAVRANILTASRTNLTVTVPTGATYAPITVTVDGLTAYAPQAFLPSFAQNDSPISSSSFASRLDIASGKGPIQAVVADLDGDGKPDLVVANDYNNSISLYRNISTGGELTSASFAPRVDIMTPPGTYSPYGLVVADVDGDGRLDIVATDYQGTNVVSVYHNNCTPGNISSNDFAMRVDFPTGSNPQGLAVRDLNGDGRPDILTANTGDGTISILQNTCEMGTLNSNSFAAKVDIATGNGCNSVAVGDLDGDGKPDVVGVNNGSGTLSLLRNISSTGNITVNSFAPKVDIAVMSGLIQVVIGDLDGDGKPDLAVTSYLPQTLSVLRNISSPGSLTTSSFAPAVNFSLGGRGHTPVIADLNGDGKPDLAVATEINSLLSLYENKSTPGSFTAASLASRIDLSTGWNAWGVTAGDLDGDGRPDLIFCNSYDNTISIYQNQSPVVNAPVITQQPTNQTVIEGDPVTFNVLATGESLTFQWMFNGRPIINATNNSLVIPMASSLQMGNYSVTVANPTGSVTSSNATLAIIVPDCTEAPSSLVGWWAGNGNALDSVGTNHGVLVGQATYAFGKDNQAFNFDGNGDAVSLGNPVGLQLQNFTIECWIKRASTSVSTLAPSQTTAGFLDYGYGGYGFGMYDDGSLFLTRVGIDNVTIPSALTDTNWHHVAVTKNGTNVVFFVDGKAFPAPSPYMSTFTFNSNITIGARGDNLGNSFLGSIDEMSIYSRALSSNDIVSIYAARGTGKCPLPPNILSVTPTNYYVNEGASIAYTVNAAGSPLLSYQWQHDGTDLTDATNSTLELDNVVYAQKGNYDVVVTGPGGWAVSSNVVLRVNRSPIADASATDFLTVSPNASNAIVVLNGSKSSDPDGDPLTYGWFHAGESIPFATGMIAMKTLPLGTNQLVLSVNDGMASSSQPFTIEIISTSEAVDRLISKVQNGSTNIQSLVTSLEAALASIDGSQPQVAINQLEAFINKVQSQLQPLDPTLAAQLINDAQTIIDALNGGLAIPSAQLEISSISHDNNGKAHLKVRGGKSQIYIIETSTNMVDWVPVGEATQNSDGTWEYDDAQTPNTGMQFYRVVSP